MSFCVNRRASITVVPMHPGEFPRPLLQTILKQAGVPVEEFRKLL
jgi:predicted RNA binding protein YcfA (HicA-like mRNA interferase family)